MKKILAILIPVFAFLLCLSCDHHEQMGFPKSVYFSKEGGEQVVTGSPIWHISIENLDYKKMKETQIDDLTIEIQYDWITITYTASSPDIHLKVAPNTTGKKRKVILNPYNDPDYAIIKVEQGR